jgi:hypothetical protein
MNRQQAEALLQQFGAAMGLSDLCFDDASTCLLVLEDTSTVSLAHDQATQQLVMTSPLDAVEVSESVMRKMLSANFLWQQTQGATLALTPSGRAAVLQRAVPDTTDASALVAAFEAFALLSHRCNGALSEPGMSPSRTLPMDMLKA